MQPNSKKYPSFFLSKKAKSTGFLVKSGAFLLFSTFRGRIALLIVPKIAQIGHFVARFYFKGLVKVGVD
jgi:hypothetical protein